MDVGDYCNWGYNLKVITVQITPIWEGGLVETSLKLTRALAYACAVCDWVCSWYVVLMYTVRKKNIYTYTVKISILIGTAFLAFKENYAPSLGIWIAAFPHPTKTDCCTLLSNAGNILPLPAHSHTNPSATNCPLEATRHEQQPVSLCDAIKNTATRSIPAIGWKSRKPSCFLNLESWHAWIFKFAPQTTFIAIIVVSTVYTYSASNWHKLHLLQW